MKKIKVYSLTAIAVAAVTLSSCGSGNNKPTNDTAGVSLADTAMNKAAADSLPAQATAPDPTIDLIKKSLVNNLVKNDLKTLTENDRKFSYSTADINGDGKKEIFVGMKGGYFCGSGGCTVYLLSAEGEKITRFTIVDGPIAVSADKSNGWSDLIIPSKGVNYLVKFNGKTYPSNPSVQPKVTAPVPAELVKVLADNEPVYNF